MVGAMIGAVDGSDSTQIMVDGTFEYDVGSHNGWSKELNSGCIF